jgi:sarcosine oxidase subunit beta
MVEERTDIIIIGAGIAGLSIAYELLYAGCGKVVVLEKEPLPGMVETAKTTGGIRFQFSDELNIKLSLIARKRLAKIEEQENWPIDFHKTGYLFLASTDEHVKTLKEGQEIQHKLGIPSQFLDNSQIRQKLASFSLDDVLGGSICPWEGHADPSRVVDYYVRQIKQRGGEIRTRVNVTGIIVNNGAVAGVETEDGRIMAATIVNTAGRYASHIASMAGVSVPVTAHKRHVMVILGGVKLDKSTPLIIDMATGWYMKVEAGGSMLIGGTDRVGKPSMEETPDPEAFDVMIEAAIGRVPGLENAGVVRSFAGLRSMSPDDLPVLGEDHRVKGFFHACGFSGHGFMHAPAVGLITADLVKEGKTDRIDVSAFSTRRFESACPRREGYVF